MLLLLLSELRLCCSINRSLELIGLAVYKAHQTSTCESWLLKERRSY